MQETIQANTQKIVEGPIWAFMLNCPNARATIQFENAAPQTVNGKQTFHCPQGRPWKRLVINTLDAPYGVDFWRTTEEGENLPIIEASVSNQGASFVSQTSRMALANAIQVTGAGLVILSAFGATAPNRMFKLFVQNNGPSDIEIYINAIGAVGTGIIVPSGGGNLSVNVNTAIFARTVDNSAQVSPADTRIWVESA